MGELENVLKTPDEVWRGVKGSGRYGAELFTKYVKYYRGQPMVALVDKDMNVRTIYAIGQKELEDLGIEDAGKFSNDELIDYIRKKSC